jgi:hypothetical protein
MTAHLRLVEPFTGGPAPEYLRHDGWPVTWRPWKLAEPLTHVRLACSVCGDTDVWSTSGLVGPLPDEPSVTEAWSTYQLFAFRCSSCGDTTVFDTGESGAAWVEIDLTQGALW